jgi:hypothetical protein
MFRLSFKRHVIAPQSRTVGAQSHVTAHGKADGYIPGWRFVPPPGIGDAPQHPYTTYSLIPFSVEGPGDEPATYFKNVNAPPIIQQFAMRQQGMGVTGGNLLMTGLYTPQPLDSPANDQFY